MLVDSQLKFMQHIILIVVKVEINYCYSWVRAFTALVDLLLEYTFIIWPPHRQCRDLHHVTEWLVAH